MGTETPEEKILPKTEPDPSQPLDQNVSDDNPAGDEDEDEDEDDEDETGNIELPGDGSGQGDQRDRPGTPGNP